MDFYNINTLKAHLNVESIDLYPTRTEEGEETPWLRSWDNENRVMIVMHTDVADAAATSHRLGVKTTTQASQTSGEEYTKHVVFDVSPVKTL